MNTRLLTSSEEDNLKVVRGSAGDFALLFVTATGLEKAILDATLPLRTLLKEKGIHDFNTQGQGKESKVLLSGIVVEDSRRCPIRVSLYRPESKQGDPRLWPYSFTEYAQANDVFTVYVQGGLVHLLNLTRSKIAEDIRNGRDTVASRFFRTLGEEVSAVSVELLQLLREVAGRGPLRAVCCGDTAIGRSIEAALGINMNAKKAPDFKGIEIKSYRSNKPDNGLITLFSKVPDWKRSMLKNSNGFLQRFGYERDGEFKLYCSVHATKANSQGLRLNLNVSVNDLEEFHSSKREEILAVWAMDTLHSAFRKKHNETFWISADTDTTGGGEYFSLRSITHTQRPIIPQFDSFIVDGQICLDHTIKWKGTYAKDHGYLFRVRQEKFTDLFTGAPRTYALC
ncbi:MAG: hypothetical protein JW384_00405 [Nitrosomonadaceae bacterium]|nr:hypothetical protein [Nitrosomonadaceae bacterium]